MILSMRLKSTCIKPPHMLSHKIYLDTWQGGRDYKVQVLHERNAVQWKDYGVRGRRWWCRQAAVPPQREPVPLLFPPTLPPPSLPPHLPPLPTHCLCTALHLPALVQQQVRVRGRGEQSSAQCTRSTGRYSASALCTVLYCCPAAWVRCLAATSANMAAGRALR